MALASMDSAVTDVVTALGESGMLPRTYIIFASDNGGCYLGGGKNAPLRGTKATILEGGTRVDAFIYSPLLSSSVWQGKDYPHLMHVTGIVYRIDLILLNYYSCVMLIQYLYIVLICS